MPGGFGVMVRYTGLGSGFFWGFLVFLGKGFFFGGFKKAGTVGGFGAF